MFSESTLHFETLVHNIAISRRIPNLQFVQGISTTIVSEHALDIYARPYFPNRLLKQRNSPLKLKGANLKRQHNLLQTC